MPVTAGPVSGTRAELAAVIVAVPCYSTPPDDVAHVPCAVVGPPTGSRDPSIAGVWTVEYPVVLIGRSYDMTEVHVELDDVLWQVLAELDAAGLFCGSWDPSTETVGGHDQPAYTLTVTTTALTC